MYNVKHGAIVSLGYVSAKCLSFSQSGKSTAVTGKEDFVKRAVKQLGRFEVLRCLHTQDWHTLVFNLFPVEVAATAKISQLLTSACGALGEIFRSGPLSQPVGDLSILSDQSKDKEWEETVKDVLTCSEDELTQLDLVTCLSKLLKSAKEIKACYKI